MNLQPSFDIEYMKRTEPFTMAYDHYHPQHEVYYLLSGERYYFIKDRTYLIQPGDLVFIPENILHKTSMSAQPQHERILINFQTGFVLDHDGASEEQSLSRFLSEVHILRLHPLEQIRVKQWLQNMIDEHREQPYAMTMLRAILTQLLIFTARLALNHQRQSAEYTKPLHKRMYEVVDYINQHYACSLSLQEVADQFHLSPFYLSRTFKQVTGFTYVEFVNAVRIREAQMLLRQTQMKIIDIATATGFENLSHFGRVFKQISKVSPRQYRQLQARDDG